MTGIVWTCPVSRNTRRTVEVWLDEYKAYFYENNVYARTIPYGE